MAIALIAIAYAGVTPLLPVGPTPTDDLFYIDAAYRITDGSFHIPTRTFPNHHYLRWPVTLPLAGLFAVIGPGDTALAMYTLAHVAAIGILSLVIVHALVRDWAVAALAALTPLAMPADMLPLLVRCEPAALVWALASIAVAIRTRGRFAALVCGALMAVSVNATNIAIFSAPIPLLLLLQRSGLERRGRVMRALLFILGACVIYEGIMLAEWLALGDYMIQFKSMNWWHFRPQDKSVTWAMRFDANDRKSFVFGLLLNLFRQQPVFGLFLLFGALGLTTADGWGRTLARQIVPTTVVAIVLIEWVGGFVVEKLYIRFLTIPVYLVALCVIAGVVQLFRRPRAGLSSFVARRPVSGIAIAVAAFGSLALYAPANASRRFSDDDGTHYYRDPIDAITRDMRSRDLRAGDVAIVTDEDGEYGMVQWPWAIRCYSDFKLAGAATCVEEHPEPDAARVATYVIATKGVRPAAEGAWRTIRYDDKYAGRRPIVYAGDATHDSAATTKTPD